jgi:hypothetical protein
VDTPNVSPLFNCQADLVDQAAAAFFEVDLGDLVRFQWP